MTIKKRADVSTKKVFLHRVADIPGGISIKASELGGAILEEGTPVGAPVNGVCSVAKSAKVLTAVLEAGTAIEIAKGSHFKVGDLVMAAAGAKAYAITAIDKSNSAKDVLTIGTAIGVIAKDAIIYQATAEAADDTSALKVTAKAIIGTSAIVDPTSNITADAWVIAVTKNNPQGALYSATLPGIINL